MLKIFWEILNLEGHPNRITGSIVFAEWMDFAHWWSFSGGGFAINGATPSSFLYDTIHQNVYKI